MGRKFVMGPGRSEVEGSAVLSTGDLIRTEAPPSPSSSRLPRLPRLPRRAVGPAPACREACRGACRGACRDLRFNPFPHRFGELSRLLNVLAGWWSRRLVGPGLLVGKDRRVVAELVVFALRSP